MGAFKCRGAYNAIAQFFSRTKSGGRRCLFFRQSRSGYSAFGKASLRGVKSVIVMPSDAPAIKIAATRDYGSEVIFYNRHVEDREAVGRRADGEKGPHPPSRVSGCVASAGQALGVQASNN